MPNIEKVIKDLDELYRLIYQSNVDGEILCSLYDTVVLLKEQEPKPIKDRFKLPNLNVKFGGCPKCNASLDDRQYPYSCGFCGQAVKWDG